MRGKQRKITVKLIEQECITNTRLVEFLANKYKERKIDI